MMTVARIKAAVAAHYGLTIEDLDGIRRKRVYAWPRQLAMLLCHRLTEFSNVRIGMFFGRNHSTVIHALRAADLRYRESSAARHDLRCLTKQLLIEERCWL